MDFYEAFNETLNRFDHLEIEAVNETGLSVQRIN
jgi:hypothetical protein